MQYHSVLISPTKPYAACENHRNTPSSEVT